VFNASLFQEALMESSAVATLADISRFKCDQIKGT